MKPKQYTGNNTHSFINFPNKAHRKCTACGVMKHTTTKNGDAIVTYEKNGVIFEGYVECVDRNFT